MEICGPPAPPGLENLMDAQMEIFGSIAPSTVLTPILRSSVIGKTRSPAAVSKDQMIMLAEHFPPEGFYSHYESGALFTRWETLIRELQRVCPRGKVAVIPCSPIQLPRIV